MEKGGWINFSAEFQKLAVFLYDTIADIPVAE